MQNLINSIRKDTVYSYYEVLVEKPKSYERITRYKMVQEIQEAFRKDPHMAIDFLSLNHFEKFQEVSKEKSDYVLDEKYHIYTKRNLEEILFVEEFKRIDNKMSCKLIPEIKDSINAIKNIDDMILKKEVEAAVLGFLDVYGYIDTVEIYDTIFEVFDGYEFDMMHHETIFKYLYIKDLEYTEDGRYHFHQHYDHEFYDVIPSYRVIYDKELYIEFALYGIPKQIIENYPKELIYPAYKDDMHAFARITHIHLQDDFDPMVYFNKSANDPDYDKALLEMNWPIWKWGGMTFFIYIQALEDEVLTVDKEFIKNAHDTIIAALNYADIQPSFEPIDDDEVSQAIIDLFEDDEFKNEVLKTLTHQDFEDIKPFKHAIVIHDGIILHQQSGVALIHHDDTNYLVESSTKLLEDFIDLSQVPSYLDGVLLPLDDGITFLGDFVIKEPYLEDDMFEDTRTVASFKDLFDISLN